MYQFLAYTNYNILGKNINTIKKNKDASKGVVLEVNTEKTK